MIVGCYTIHLYCDDEKHDERTHSRRGLQLFDFQFSGLTESECLRNARRGGWSVNRPRGLATCPICVKEGK